MPGRFVQSEANSMFQIFFTPKLKEIIGQHKGFQSKFYANQTKLFSACLNDSNALCQAYLIKGIEFFLKMEVLFPKRDISKAYLEERPGKYNYSQKNKIEEI